MSFESLTPSLADKPRARLANLPTPLEFAARLSARLGGPRIWLKRDDLTGLAFGGNKTRKLEFLIGAARAEGATHVLTFGAVQSNHVRQTAAAAAKVGLACEAILSEVVPIESAAYRRSGNLQLDRLLGARCWFVSDASAAQAQANQRVSALESQGARVYVIPVGGSTALGALGYVEAGCELVAQMAGAALSPATIMHASSSGGTQAGMAVALDLAEPELRLVGVNAYQHDVTALKADVERLATATASLLGVAFAGSIEIDHTQFGSGYGIPTHACVEAIRLVAETEGVLLDPVYSGKAMAALIARARGGMWRSDDDVVFIHTGGAPSLPAYVDEIEALGGL